jgi:hypothetical protein
MRKSKLASLASKLALLLTLCLAGCAQFRPGWVDENSFTVDTSETDITDADFDGPLGGHFNDDGEWIPDDATIGWTYRIPDISSGFLFDVRELKATPTLQVELLELDMPWKYLSTYKIDFGVGYQRTYGYLGVRLTSIFEISIGIVGGWNWDRSDYFYGPAFTIIKF